MGVCFIIILVIMILNVFLPKKTTKSMFDKSNLLILLVIVFFLFPISLVKLYAVNCMLEGNCDILVYVLEGILIFITFVYVVLFMLKVIKQRKAIVVSEESKRM